MKKVLSLAAMFAVLAYASPASAELKLGGDASMRVRGQFQDTEVNGTNQDLADENDLNFAYRLRLKASADLGNGYFFKSMLTTDSPGTNATSPTNGLRAGGWNTIDASNGEDPELDISQLYFGRMMQDSHWMVGRLPLNSVNNPIFDLALYPITFNLGTKSPVGIADTAVPTYNMDRVYGINYGTKIGSGEANATLVIFDNASKDNTTGIDGDGLFNDGYALHLAYKDKIGDVTVEPQAIIALTNLNGLVYQQITPYTIGANLSMPAGDAKIGVSAFYTACDDDGRKNNDIDGDGTLEVPTEPAKNEIGADAAKVEYSGYLLRLKGELGNALAWIDYNKTTDKTDGGNVDYDNVFVWAQYTFKMHESAAGSFSLTPTIRYWAAGSEEGNNETDYSRLRTELVATVTF